MTNYRKSQRWFLGAIVGCYLVLGWLYARWTPNWQAPDEPAHYNYVTYLAENHRLPVLQAGDYPHEYLEQLKSSRFAPSLSISPLRYESHQPPLYYVLAAVVYWAGGQQLLWLRLFSVALGAAYLVVLFQVLRQVFPRSRSLPLISCGLVAVLPMRLAMTAAVNNDGLAELLLLLVLWQALQVVRSGPGRRGVLISGALLGLVLLTKTTVYLQAGLLTLAASFLHGSSGRVQERFQNLLRFGVPAVLLALLIALPFFARNIAVYGWGDPLGWARHDSIVTGQLRTVDLLAQIGPLAFVQRFVLTTFHSFWGQFGWMGVLIDVRLYRALALFTALIVTGGVLAGARLWLQRRALAWDRMGVLLLLLLLLGASVATYLGYNLKFVQHQGRYLYPALPALAAVAAAGLAELSRRRVGTVVASLLMLAAGLVGVGSVVLGDPAEWTVATLGLASLLVLLWSRSRQHWRWAAAGVVYLMFLVLDWLCLFEFIVPMLRPTG